MAVYAKGNKFMASFGAGSSRIRQTFGTETDGVAWVQAQEAAREASKGLPEAMAVSTCWSLQKSCDETCRHVWAANPGGIKAPMVNAKQALAFFGPDTPVSEIVSARVVEWMDECLDDGNSSSTLNRKLSCLRVMLDRAMRNGGGIDTLPWMTRYAEGMHRVAWYTDADEDIMLSWASRMGLSDLHDFILVALDTGFRRSELLRVRVADFVGGRLILHAGTTKTQWARSVPCTPRVADVITSRAAMGHSRIFHDFNDGTLTRQWQSLRAQMKRLEDPYFIVHVLRHTCATRLVAAGNTLDAVKGWMGHTSIATTMRYAHLMPRALDDAMQSLANRRSA